MAMDRKGVIHGLFEFPALKWLLISIFILSSLVWNITILKKTYADNVLESKCGQIKKSTIPALQNLRKVNLYVNFPSFFVTASECHGKEEECADKYPLMKNDKKRREQYIKAIRDKYKVLPSSLQPEQLTQSFKAELESKLSPFLELDAECKHPEVKILKSSEFLQSTSENNTLTVVVLVQVQEETHPPVAVVSTDFYRAPSEAIDWRFRGFNLGSLAIPLTEKPKNIEILLQQFISNAVPSGASPLTQD